MKILLNCLTILFIFLTVSACKNNIVHGKVLSPEMIEKIKNNHPSKEEVRRLIGEPTFINEGKWYYINTLSTKRVFLKPALVKEEVVIVDFKNNLVNEVNIIDKSADLQNIKMVKDIEDPKGYRPNKFQEAIYNLQRFKANPRHKF